MDKSNQGDEQPQSTGTFKFSSKLIAVRDKEKKQSLGLSNLSQATQIPAQKNDNPSRGAHSLEPKSKLKPNPNIAVKRDTSYDQSSFGEVEDIPKPKESGPKTMNLLEQPNKLDRRHNNRYNTPNLSKHRTTIMPKHTYGPTHELPQNLFENDMSAENVYEGKKLLFPIDVKVKTDDNEGIVSAVGKKPEELSKEKDIIGDLDQYHFFQLPANLPLEGYHELTPKTENPDVEINTDDLLSSFLNNRFDSTGFYLEREFKVLKNREKMQEEKEMGDKKGKESVGKANQEIYETYRLGKLCRMKNGQIKLKIGNNFFDVTEGVQDSFYKELFAVDYNEEVAMSLFPIQSKLVVKPDMESFY